MRFLTGKGRNIREIDIIKIVQVIETQKCQGFIGPHKFSGAYCCEKCVRITRKTWADAYRALDDDDPAIDCFQNLGTALNLTQLTHGELPPQSRI